VAASTRTAVTMIGKRAAITATAEPLNLTH